MSPDETRTMQALVDIIERTVVPLRGEVRRLRETLGRAEQRELSALADLDEAVGALKGLADCLGADPRRALDVMRIHDFDSISDFNRAVAQLRAEIAGRAIIAKTRSGN